MNFVEIVECEMKRKRITGIFNLKSRVVSIIMIIFFPYGGWGVEKGRKTGGVPAETAWWWRCRRRSFFFLLEVSSCSCVAFIRDAAPSEKARAFSLSACPVVTSLFDPLASVCRLLFVRMCFCLF